ncbi:hypothetical protein BCEP27_20761 [Burkholderia cepacia]
MPMNSTLIWVSGAGMSRHAAGQEWSAG